MRDGRTCRLGRFCRLPVRDFRGAESGGVGDDEENLSHHGGHLAMDRAG